VAGFIEAINQPGAFEFRARFGRGYRDQNVELDFNWSLRSRRRCW